MNKMIWVKITEQLIMRLIIFITVISWYVLGAVLVANFFPLTIKDTSWAFATMKPHLYCFGCIVLVYCIFPLKKRTFFVTILLLTVTNIYFFSQFYPYRSLEMSVRSYICLVIPVAISWYIKKSSNIKNNESNNNLPDSKKLSL